MKKDFLCLPLLRWWSVVYLTTSAWKLGGIFWVCVGQGALPNSAFAYKQAVQIQSGEERHTREGRRNKKTNMATVKEGLWASEERVPPEDDFRNRGLFVPLRCWGAFDLNRVENLITWEMHCLCLHALFQRGFHTPCCHLTLPSPLSWPELKKKFQLQ